MEKKTAKKPIKKEVKKENKPLVKFLPKKNNKEKTLKDLFSGKNKNFLNLINTNIERIQPAKKEISKEVEETKGEKKEELSDVLEGAETKDKKEVKEDGKLYSSVQESYQTYLNNQPNYGAGLKVDITSSSDKKFKDMSENQNVRRMKDLYQTETKEREFEMTRGEAKFHARELREKQDEFSRNVNISSMENLYQKQHKRKREN